MPSESGDHLVENEQRAFFPAKTLDLMQEAICRVISARRLEDHQK